MDIHVPLRGWFQCAIGRHFWTGGGWRTGGKQKHAFWCVRCHVKFGVPPYDGEEYDDK